MPSTIEVEEPGYFHYDFSRNQVKILVDEELVEKYKQTKKWLSKLNFVSIPLENLMPDILTKIYGLLLLELEHISIKLYLLVFALLELSKRVVVSAYEIVRYPAVFGKMRIGSMSKIGVMGYTLKSVEIHH